MNNKPMERQKLAPQTDDIESKFFRKLHHLQERCGSSKSRKTSQRTSPVK